MLSVSSSKLCFNIWKFMKVSHFKSYWRESVSSTPILVRRRVDWSGEIYNTIFMKQLTEECAHISILNFKFKKMFDSSWWLLIFQNTCTHFNIKIQANFILTYEVSSNIKFKHLILCRHLLSHISMLILCCLFSNQFPSFVKLEWRHNF